VASVEQRVIDIVAEQLRRQPRQITRETSFVNDLWRRLPDTVELVMELEEEFDITFRRRGGKNPDGRTSHRAYFQVRESTEASSA